MKVRCISTYPTKEQLNKLGKSFYKNQGFFITVGKEYIVIAMQFEVNAVGLGTGAWIQLLSDYNHLAFVPLCLFEVIDASIPKIWEVRLSKDGAVCLWPPSFYQKYYHDDLSEGISEVIEDFNKVRAIIEQESISY